MRYLLVLSVLLATGCAGAAHLEERPPQLSGTWELAAVVNGGDSLALGDGLSPETATFGTDGSLNVRSCNVCRGSFTQDGDRLDLAPMACTRRACGQPYYLETALAGTFRIEAVGDLLRLTPLTDPSVERLYLQRAP